MRIKGATVLRTSTPSLVIAERVLLLPASGNYNGGLYTSNFEPIPSAMTFRGDEPRISTPVPDIFKQLNLEALPRYACPEGYVFCGELLAHFGHFILESIARLWPALNETAFTSRTPVVLSRASVETMASKSYVSGIFAALNIDSTRMMAFDSPCFLENVLIPAPAFEIRRHAYANFFSLTSRIGSNLLGAQAVTQSEIPLYLSKAKLRKGLSKIFNESEIEEELKRYGVTVVHPEQMSFSDQIRSIESHRCILGSVGSAFHTMLFTSGAKRVRGIVMGDVLNSNFMLIDKGLQNIAEYVPPRELGLRRMDSSELPKDWSIRRTFFCEDVNRYCEWMLAL